MSTEVFCVQCCQPCAAVEETFDYSGTHCTHGKNGTHRTGHYVSDCCGAEVSADEPGPFDYLETPLQ